MNIMSWNMQGLNSSHKQEILCNLIKDHKPNIILVQESKIPKERVEKLKLFTNCGVHGNSSEDAFGGITSF